MSAINEEGIVCFKSVRNYDKGVCSGGNVRSLRNFSRFVVKDTGATDPTTAAGSFSSKRWLVTNSGQWIGCPCDDGTCGFSDVT